MGLSATFVSGAVIVWFAIIAGIVGYQLLSGKIATTGLMRSSTTGAIDPERVQLLIGTIAAAAYYAATAFQQDIYTDTGIVSLPDVPDAMLVLLAGSQSLYVGGKLTRRIASPTTPESKGE